MARANLALMGIPPDGVENMDLWEYESLLYHWNIAQGGGGDVEPPDPVVAQRIIDLANADPRLTGRAPAA